MFADIFVLLSFMAEREAFESPSIYRASLHEFESPMRNNAPKLICLAFGALLASLLPELISLTPAAPQYIDKTEYSLIVFVLFHLSVFACVKYDRARRNAKRSFVFDAVCAVYPAVMAAILVLCFTVPAVSKMFGIEGFSHLLYLFIAPIAPIICAALYFLLGNNSHFAALVGRIVNRKK
jgi:hypothetical protein